MVLLYRMFLYADSVREVLQPELQTIQLTVKSLFEIRVSVLLYFETRDIVN